MGRPLTFGSLFDGIGCFTLGLRRAGLVPKWLVEIDADCRRVTARHFLGVPQFADVREVGAANLEPVDVIVGGFPCQDLSVAGKRGGLQGERSGLFYEMTRITHELQPRLLVWENVPGLLSSFTAVNPPPPDAAEGSEWELDEDSDFEAVLCELRRIGFHRGGWTSLDARFFGVAQRRRRVFGVFARGDVGADCAAEILALSSRGQGDFAPRGEAGQGVAASLRSRSSSPGVSPPGRGGEDDSNLVCADLRNGRDAGDVATTIQANGHGACPNGTPHVFQANGAATFRGGAVSLASSDDNGSNQVVTHTLRAEWRDAGEDGTGRGTPLAVVPLDMRQASRGGTMTNNRSEGAASGGAPGTGIGEEGDPAPTVAASHTPAVAFNWQSGGSKNFVGAKEEHTDALGACQVPAVKTGMIVRRLMPVECLRLQGLPDDWLDLDPPLSDSAKYRMIGNGGAVPVMEWIGRRVVATIGA